VAGQYQLAGSTATEIAASVEAGVRSGQLPPGAALPPVRALATNLQVSPATVASAYQALRGRGVVETSGRNGTRVRPRPPVLGERGQWRLSVPDGAVDLSSGMPDARLLPDLEPVLANPISADLAELAAAVFARDGVASGAIGIAGGALDAIERLLSAHLRPGDRVAVEDPGWANLLDLLAAMGLVPVAVPMDDEGPSPSGLTSVLSAGARAVVITTRAHNPTGAAVTAARAGALRLVLGTFEDTLVIEDDHAGPLSAVPLHSVCGVTAHWAFVRSVSKPYGVDLRCAPFVADPTTAARVDGRQRLGTGWVSSILQRAVASLWSSPRVAELVAAAGRSYDERRAGLVAALRERGLDAAGRTGLNVWVRVPDETLVVTALRDAGWAVAPGALYRISSPPGFRVTVSRLDRADIPVFADAVVAAMGARSAARSW
jgi:DNA-binding transcriptional MocR family regulator